MMHSSDASTTLTRFDENERDFLHHNAMRDVFGSYLEGCKLRKREDGLVRSDLEDRLGKDKTGVSKLLSKPSNWTLRTLSDFANALEMSLHIILRDRKNPRRYIDRTGIHYEQAGAEGDAFIEGECRVLPDVSNSLSSIRKLDSRGQLSVNIFPIDKELSIAPKMNSPFKSTMGFS